MTAPLSEEYLAQVEARCDAAPAGPWHVDNHSPDLNRWVTDATGLMEINFGYRGNNNQAEAEFTAHARTDMPALVAEVRRLRAEVARVTPKSSLHGPAVDQLVDMVTAELANGPCWVLSAPGGQSALVGTNPDGGLRFIGVFRRATLSDAADLGLLNVSHDLVPLPQYTGGTGRWAWSTDIPGRPVTLGGGAR